MINEAMRRLVTEQFGGAAWQEIADLVACLVAMGARIEGAGSDVLVVEGGAVGCGPGETVLVLDLASRDAWLLTPGESRPISGPAAAATMRWPMRPAAPWTPSFSLSVMFCIWEWSPRPGISSRM